jgi:hypothetical protein
MNDKYTKAEIAAGEARMASILEEYAQLGLDGLPPAGTSVSDMRHRFSAPNLLALVVRPQGRGWIADVVLRQAPPGEPDVVGTPEAQPLRTRKEAVRQGRRLVGNLLAHAMASFWMEDRPVVVRHSLLSAARGQGGRGA